MVYLMMKVGEATCHQMVEVELKMNLEQFVRKYVWPVLRYRYIINLQALRNTTRNIV
jgi:hypothetical protein